MDNFKIIYKILSVLEKSMDLENVDIERISSNNLGISQQRWNKYMEMLLDAGYIKGVTIQKYVTGETNVDAEDIRITLKGLEYLSENSIMQKMYKAAKGINKKHPHWMLIYSNCMQLYSWLSTAIPGTMNQSEASRRLTDLPIRSPSFRWLFPPGFCHLSDLPGN